MKVLLFAVIGFVLLFNACNNNKPAVCKTGDGKSSGACPATTGGSAAKAPALTGIVADTINTAGYTYVQVNTGEAKVWVAGPQCKVTVGDTVTIVDAMPMKEYHSKTLNRTFDLVYFAGNILRKGDAVPANNACAIKPGASSMEQISLKAAMAGHTPQIDPGIKTDFSKIKKVPNAITVAELYSQKETLKGKKVVLCGIVVHANNNIMSKNWLHLRDGTGNEGSNDVTVTTIDNPPIGQVVVAEGMLVKDKNIGAGYKFALLIEDAKVVVQK